MQVQITEESIRNANALFWEQMLTMRLEPVRDFAEESSSRSIGPRHVVGFCELAGVWQGRIEVRLAHGLAVQATAAMLMQAAEGVNAEDMLDATREIANMIAGTLKSALPRPCTMTVPTAEVEGADVWVPARTRDSVTVFFHHDSGELMIRVWQRVFDEESEIAVSTPICA